MFDRILDLPVGQRRLLYGGSAALIAIFYVFWFYLPRSQELAEIQQKFHDLDAERTTLQKILVTPEKLDAEIIAIEAAFNHAQSQLPDQKEIPELLRQVSNLGRDSGLEVILFRQKPEQLKDLYAEVPVQMSVRGGYHHIAMFFDKVRRLDRIVNIADISLKEPRPVGGQITIDAAFSATTYRFLSEEERERIAKQKAEAEAGTKKKKRKRK